MFQKRWPCALAMVASLAASSNATADANKTQADEIYDKALAKMKAGNFGTACPMLAESYRLDPTPGVLYAMGLCEYRLNHLKSSRAKLSDFLAICATLSMERQRRYRDRAAAASEKLHFLEDAIPSITLFLPPSMPIGARVFLDEQPLANTVLGAPIELDPGKHVVTATLPDGHRRSETLNIKLRERKTHVIGLPRRNAENDIWISSVLQRGPINGRQRLAFPLLGLGAAGFVTWGVTGGLAMANRVDLNPNCRDSQCNDVGMATYGKIRMLANTASVGLGVGIAGVAVGTIMIVIGRKQAIGGPEKPKAHIVVLDMGSTGAGLGVKGVF